MQSSYENIKEIPVPLTLPLLFLSDWIAFVFGAGNFLYERFK